MKNIRKIIGLFSLISMIISGYGVSSALSGEPIHFNKLKKTDTWCDYGGKLSVDGFYAVDGEDELGVFTKVENGNEILIGSCVFGNPVSGHYFIHVYGDDITTQEKDGVSQGEVLIFKIWDKSADREFTVPSALMNYEHFSGLSVANIPPVFIDGFSYGLLNMKVNNPESSSISLPVPVQTPSKSDEKTNKLIEQFINKKISPTVGNKDVSSLQTGEHEGLPLQTDEYACSQSDGQIIGPCPALIMEYVPGYNDRIHQLKGYVVELLDCKNYTILVYIYKKDNKKEGWYTKPFVSKPMTRLNEDGTWLCDITTAQNDPIATKIGVFLIRSKWVSKSMILQGETELPKILFSNSLRYEIITRSTDKAN